MHPGLALGLRVDGLWVGSTDVEAGLEHLLLLSFWLDNRGFFVTGG